MGIFLRVVNLVLRAMFLVSSISISDMLGSVM
jgi:hypothetical protein